MIDLVWIEQYRGHRGDKYRCTACGAKGFLNQVTALAHLRDAHEVLPLTRDVKTRDNKVVVKTRGTKRTPRRQWSQLMRTKIAVSSLSRTVQRFLDMVGK